MQSIRNTQVAALLASASTAFAHAQSGGSAIHWHASDLLGLALVGALSVGALLVWRRQWRAAKKLDKQ